MQKKLYKSSKEKMISGVAGGIAEYFEIDPVFVRLLFVVLAFFNGIGLIAYIVCAIVMPKETVSANVVITHPNASEGETSFTEKSEVRKEEKNINKNEKRNRTIGIILIIIGIILLANEILPTFDFEEILPILFIIFGLWLLLNSFSKNTSDEDKSNDLSKREDL